MSDLRVTVIGLSYSPLQNGAFALLLSVEGNSRVRIPVVIGAPEAQSIAMHLEKVQPARPMTHDLFTAFGHAFGIRLMKVRIASFTDGVFASEMTFTDGERTVVIDARTSDAIAIALRTRAPIFTTQAIVDAAGIDFANDNDNDDAEVKEEPKSETETAEDQPKAAEPAEERDHPAPNIEKLEKLLDRSIRDEDYERAARLRDKINRLKGSNNNHNNE